MPEPILSASKLRKSFTEADDGGTLVILDGIDLEVAAGETVAITGPSGCGKSTLLNLLGTLDTPDDGTIRIQERDLTGLDDKALARLRAEKIGFVFQLHHLLPQLTAIENVLLPTLAFQNRNRRAASEERARQLLEAVGMSNRLHHRPGQLSGGERQRTAVARALINTPRLLLADEPTGALDERNAEGLVELLTRLAEQEGMAVVAVTHDLDAAATMTRSYRLEKGMLVRA